MMLQERSFKLKEQAACVFDNCTCLHICELGSWSTKQCWSLLSGAYFMLFKFFRHEGLWRLWANMCVYYERRADMHLSFKKQNTRLRAVEWLRLGGWTETILMLWGWATTKGVFGSKTKQLGCRLLVTVIWKEGGSGPTRSLVGQWWRSLGKVSCPSERIIVIVICNLDTSGFKSHGWIFLVVCRWVII